LIAYDIAKPETQKIWPDGGISNYKHAEIGAEKVQGILQRLGETPQRIEQAGGWPEQYRKSNPEP
jgi:hypothetical protein